jgi:hypothetical protein
MHDLGAQIFEPMKEYFKANGMAMKQQTISDTTLNTCPSPTLRTPGVELTSDKRIKSP